MSSDVCSRFPRATACLYDRWASMDLEAILEDQDIDKPFDDLILALEAQLMRRRGANEEVLVCEEALVDYLKACNAALLQFGAMYRKELHPNFYLNGCAPFNDSRFAAISDAYISHMQQQQVNSYEATVAQLRERGDVQMPA